MPGATRRLVRGLGLRGFARGRMVRQTITWHDTADTELFEDGLCLAEIRSGRRTLWRLEQARPGPDAFWPVGAVVRVVALGHSPAQMPYRLPEGLAPVAQGVVRLKALPDAALHALRLHAKRLRYAAEMFAPLYARREVARFIRRVSALQEQLGHLNDGAVASGLLDKLAPGIGEGFAGGAVRGFVAAGTGDVRAEIGAAWRKFRKTEPFWD